MDDKLIFSITLTVLSFIFTAVREIYIHEHTNIVERRLLSQNERFLISISNFSLILVFLVSYSFTAMYYMEYVHHVNYIWTYIVIAIFTVVAVIVMFFLTIDQNQDILLVAKSPKKNSYDKYFLRTKTSDGHLSLLTPDMKRTEFISFDELTNYSLEVKKSKAKKYSTSSTQLLNELQDLLDSGVLTKKEFTAKKKQILKSQLPSKIN